MTLNDKVQVGETTTGTSTSTSTLRHCPYAQPKAEQGWECPRCGRINAPWVRQCDCSRNDKWEKWDITWNKDDCTKPWWYDYKVTCQGTQSNKVDPNVTAWNTNPDIAINDFTTYRTDVPNTQTIHNGKTNYKE